MKSNAIKEFKQKDVIIKKIGIDYKKANLIKENNFIYEEEKGFYLKEEDFYLKIKSKVDYVLMNLERELSMILYKEYFSVKDETWWVYYFSKSTYYRLKNKAMKEFLEWWYA